MDEEKHMRAIISKHRLLKKLNWRYSYRPMKTLWTRIMRVDFDMLRELNEVCKIGSGYCVTITSKGESIRIEVY